MNPRERTDKMAFQQEMELFFRAYPEKDRERVQTSVEYQAAAKKGDAIEAQEIACRMLEGNVNGTDLGRLLRRYLPLAK